MASLVALLLIPALAHAQRIPDRIIWSAAVLLIAPIIAVPVKLGLSRIVGARIPLSKLWVLCAAEWILWFPIGFVFIQLIGLSVAGFGAVGLLVLSAWLHRQPTIKATGFVRLAIGPILALATPAVGLVLFLGILRA